MNQQLARTGGTSGFGGTQTTISQQRSTVTQNFAKPKRKKSGRKKQGGGNEEKEFADLTTKKNLANVQSKLDRQMNELQKEIFPMMIMDRDPYSSSSDYDIPQLEMYPGMRAQGSKGSVGGGSQASRRRSSFGSIEAENHAKHMMNNVSDKNINNAMRNLLVNIDTDIVMTKTMQSQDPIAAGNLRELLTIDPRIDQSKVGESRYLAASERAGYVPPEEEEVQENTPKARRHTRRSVAKKEDGDDPDDDDLSPIDNMRNLTPRMRHTRSYRCQSDKEINDLR